MKEMGEIDYRKWANNWDPVVEVSKIKPKVNTNYKKALELTQQDKLKKNASKHKRSASSAR